MSAETKERGGGSTGQRRLRSLELPVLIWLAIVWIAMWRDFSLANLLAGLVVGAAACLVFPLPPLLLRLRVRPVPLAWLIIHFLGSVVLASVQVTVLTLRLRQLPRNAVIEVDLSSGSDLVLTVVAEMTSLIPGSIVVEARRSTHTIFLHVLDARNQEGVEKMRREVFALERRVVRAIGADTDHLDRSVAGPTREAAP